MMREAGPPNFSITMAFMVCWLSSDRGKNPIVFSAEVVGFSWREDFEGGCRVENETSIFVTMSTKVPHDPAISGFYNG